MFRSLSEHYDAVLNLADSTPSTFSTAPQTASGLTLAKNTYAQAPVPPFHNSAMDGFLVFAQDFRDDGPWTFPIVGDVPAGGEATMPDQACAVRIMTGAPVPEHPDLAVVPVENTDIPRGPYPLPSSITIFTAPTPRAHIRTRGEDMQLGELVLPKGSRIDAAAISALIATNNTQVTVFKPVRVAIIATGDEVENQIPNSNSPLLAALCEEQGADTNLLPVAKDSSSEFRAMIDAIDHADLILTTGGISAGAFDVVKEALADTVWFGNVALQPGKPQGAGTVNGTPILCLPGNPVSVYVSFQIFVRPLLQALSGQTPVPLQHRPNVMAIAESEFPAHRTRDRFVPVVLRYTPEPHASSTHCRGLGSHFVASLARVQGLAVIPQGAHTIQVGEPVRVILG
ncbi:gephyrin-like molybdotransferase Glp [Corynebacterium sp.]|uniref:molybdopterin molybdotransferase MoeA n=1 Tax=Corynebacterium sp. TaxID=1720 RepID=UPI0026DBF407|nr:gephyrin-like molybdotransferase Glp [Corynebacterium sp.]MDO5076577.1 molybdopterin molybdotransferase MoeA [Corynebacterium sp.]